MSRQISTFLLGDLLLGVDIILVKEVYRQMTITEIPDAPKHLIGLLNLRGKVVTVINLSTCLNREDSGKTDNCKLLILKTNDEIRALSSQERVQDIDLGEDIVGFLIDRMEDVLIADDNEILPPPPNLFQVDVNLIEGVIKRENQLVILLNIELILQQILMAQKEGEND